VSCSNPVRRSRIRRWRVPKGAGRKPLSDDELRDKFIDCATIGLGPAHEWNRAPRKPTGPDAGRAGLIRAPRI
ncbi:MAG: hypothetical protein WA693_19060, partial [Pseudolabrys sp.]